MRSNAFEVCVGPGAAREPDLFTCMNPALAKRPEAKRPSVGYACLLGLAYAFVTASLALNMAGGGHGWNSAMISASGLLLIPLASIAWTSRVHRAGKILAAVVLGGTALADVLLIVFTFREGLDGVERVSAAAPTLVFCWAVFWVGWQIAFAIACGRILRTRGEQVQTL